MAEGCLNSLPFQHFRDVSLMLEREEKGITAMAWWLLLLGLMTFAVPVYGQPGFISIDCGIDEDSYQDNTTTIHYTSDAGFIDTGVNQNLSVNGELSSLARLYKDVRSFPNGSRNCYTLKPVNKGNKYLIRAYFFYGNYDGQNRIPQFDLYMGVNRLATIYASTPGYYEIITVASMDLIYVCLANTGSGTPFMSALELRPLNSSMYSDSNETQSLLLYQRIDAGSTANYVIRYPDDPYDRMWEPSSNGNWTLSTSLTVKTTYENYSQPPSTVMQTAVRPVNKSSALNFFWRANDPNLQFHVYRHFAEIELLEPNMTREFTHCCGHLCYEPYRPEYLVTFTVYNTEPLSGKYEYNCSFIKTSNSTLPPILNAIETYTILQLDPTQTNTQDVDAIMKIKATYRVEKDWIGDPCFPRNYSWEGLTCTYHGSNATTITYLNLASTGLNGEIAASLANLTSIESLDLSGNNLTGPVPDFLGQLPSLLLLNLTGNHLSGDVPLVLLERFKNGSLTLSVGDNPYLCVSEVCRIFFNANVRNKRKIIIPVASVVSAVVILLTVLVVLWMLRQRKLREDDTKNKDGSLSSESRRFTYAEVVSITNQFQRVIGKGGFGTVYYGQMKEGTQVAVKTLLQQSVKMLARPCQGSNEFQNEVHLLARIHHRNLVPLVGYCHEGDIMALIYEYMAQGNLGKHLSATDSNMNVLNWGQRIRIALDVAQGLEYLHHGCKPPIIHRDVKTSNILLNERLQAKIGDFGLSKVFLNDDSTHISTAIKGTRGYLDPEYCISNNLTAKSNVYSFGIVLLELITGQQATVRSPDSYWVGIVDWVSPMVAGGDIQKAVDPRLNGDYDVNSACKAIEIAMACTPPRSIHRPPMSDVVIKLKECLGTEIATQRSMSLKDEVEEISSVSSLYPR